MDQETKFPKEKLHVLNASFMGPAHVIGIWAGIYYLVPENFQWQLWVFVLVMWASRAIGITVGYHRYFTHRSFKCGKVMQVILTMFGNGALEGPVISWVADHVLHHQNTDKEGDPYNASRGFWHSHIGWILFKDPNRKEDYSAANHLMEDPFTARLVNFQRKYYVYYGLAISLNAFLPMGVGWLLWGNPWKGLAASFIAAVLAWHATFCINSLAHWKHWGSTQPYSRENTAQDSWIVSLITFGEGYHNYHHTLQRDYRNGPRWYNFDPSKWIIFWLSKVGLAWDLIRVPDWKREEARQAVLKMA